MAQPPRSFTDDLRVHIEALNALERRTRLGLSTSDDVARIRAGHAALFPPPAPRPVNPPLAMTRHGAVW
ncbi:hypothetical protein [Sphingomonas sp. CFBP 8760]|uniref:hypothetical protein n=1 Tax=Sphingomonas sp. CFBP 8760 TaxID=2775282 RepID=UPI00177EAEC8|nr:hypothetical protein [Sphingomonas sp. CFBP 8760]MBD8548021.1 hypothetical protein [Sphingomonas sp. CFBP 8760]